MKEETLVFIVNHNQTISALKLQEQFKNVRHTFLLDSGSRLKPKEISFFDKTFANIYYNGLINESYKITLSYPQAINILFITGDVTIDEPLKLISNFETLSKKGVGLYAPSTVHSGHDFMINDPNKKISRVTFVEGFCFGCRVDIFSKICPIDLTINKFGWATDVLLGYISIMCGRKVVVDHRITVYHPPSSGYISDDAKYESENWVRHFREKTRKFYFEILSLENKREPKLSRLLRRITFSNLWLIIQNKVKTLYHRIYKKNHTFIPYKTRI